MVEPDLRAGWLGRGMTPTKVSPIGENVPYPRRLHHLGPRTKPGLVYHIRLRVAADTPQRLTDPLLAARLLEAVQFYHVHGRWDCRVALLMPDHVHAMLSFPVQESMSATIGAWKSYTTRRLGVRWQANYFDHRIRDQHNLQVKGAYILRNPVVKGLCEREVDWPWVWPRSHVEQPARRSGSTKFHP